MAIMTTILLMAEGAMLMAAAYGEACALNHDSIHNDFSQGKAYVDMWFFTFSSSEVIGNTYLNNQKRSV